MSSNRTAAPNPILEAHLTSLIVRMTLPVLVGLITLLLFQLVNTYFVSLIGSRELAAISFTLPVCLLISHVAMGLASATTSVSSMLIGRGEQERAKCSNLHALALAIVCILPISVGGLLTIDPVFRMLGAEEALLPLIREFMTPWYAGVVLLAIPMSAHGGIRATGDTRTPAIIMASAGLLNGVLDPLFIFTLKGGMAGAAWATVTSWCMATCLALRALARAGQCRWQPLPGQPLLRSWQTLLHLALPVALTNSLVPLSAGMITLLVSRHGHEAVAAFGVGSRIESLALVVIMALGSALAPLLGQHFGAGRTDRIRTALSLSLGFSAAWGLLACLLLYASAENVAALFSDDPLTRQDIACYLRRVPTGYAGLGVIMVIGVTLNVLRQPLQGSLVQLARLFVIALPAACVGSWLNGLEGLFLGLGLGNLFAGAASWVWFVTRRREPLLTTWQEKL